MADHELKPHWQDWTLFGLRWVFLFGISLILYTARSQSTQTFSQLDLVIAFGVGAVLNLLLGAAIVFPSFHTMLPFIILVEDWVLTGIYIYITQNDALAAGDQMLLVGIMSVLIVSAMLRLGPIWGAFHTLGVIVAAAGVMIYLVGADQMQTLVEPYTIPALLVTLLTLMAGVWVYVEYEKTSGHRDALSNLARLREEQISEMRERADALSKMTDRLNSTSNIKKILDASLDLGDWSLRRKGEKRAARVISLAFLVRASDESLYMVNSRGLPYTDDNRVIAGKGGIVGKALDECVTIIGKDASKDPELSTINAFFGIRSVLCIPLRAKFDNFGVLLYGSDRPNAFNEDHIDTLNMIGIQTAVALQNAYLYNTLIEEKERIIQLEEAGRKALVRDLHDIPAQTIAAVKMRINIIQRLMERDPAQVPKELKEVEEMAQRANEEIRHILSSLNPLALESQGLKAALDQFAERVRKPPLNQKINMRVNSEAETYLDKTKQGAVYYLIEEAVGNACKYAEAQLINVAVGRKGNVMVIQIEDNGKGFDVNARNNDGRDHFGMHNMRQRAETLDGTLDMRTAPGQGTTIVVRFPIETGRKVDDESLLSQIPDSKLALKAKANFEQMVGKH